MRYRRLILIVMVTVGVFCFVASFPFFSVLERNSPTTPNPATQQTYELNDHGYLFYVTREQNYVFRILLHGGWALGVLGALLNYRWKVIHNLTAQGWQLPK